MSQGKKNKCLPIVFIFDSNQSNWFVLIVNLALIEKKPLHFVDLSLIKKCKAGIQSIYTI